MATPCEMLLYPELLSNDQLICIIQERHLHIGNLERMNRCELLEVFRNFCVPYGQRKYRDSGRGKVLNKTRHYSPEPVDNLIFRCDSHSNKTSRSNFDRIKPPPDILSGHMKRIKLESLANDVNNSKRKMSIDSCARKQGGLWLKCCIDVVRDLESLRLGVIPGKACAKQWAKDTSKEESPPVKKERKQITWP